MHPNEYVDYMQLIHSFFNGTHDYLFLALVGLTLLDIGAGVVAALLHLELDSRKGNNGLIKNIYVMLIPIIIYPFLDLANIQFVYTAIVSTFIFNQSISLVENLQKLGIPLPDFIGKFLANRENLEKITEEIKK